MDFSKQMPLSSSFFKIFIFAIKSHLTCYNLNLNSFFTNLRNLCTAINMFQNCLESTIYEKCFLSFLKNCQKTETKQVFTFQFLNDKIYQHTNFAKLPSAKCFFFGVPLNLIIKKLLSLSQFSLVTGFFLRE